MCKPECFAPPCVYKLMRSSHPPVSPSNNIATTPAEEYSSLMHVQCTKIIMLWTIVSYRAKEKRNQQLHVVYNYELIYVNFTCAWFTCRRLKSSVTLPMFFLPTNCGDVSTAHRTCGGTALAISGPPFVLTCLHIAYRVSIIIESRYPINN